MSQTGTVYTFFSYKGGAGRTMLLCNTAWLLADWGYKVLCLDYDLDAPGLAPYIADGAEGLATLEGAPGLVDWAHAVVRRRKGAAPPDPRRVYFGQRSLDYIGAGRRDPEYHERLESLRTTALDRRGWAEELEAARASWVEHYDFVLVDARAGITTQGAYATSLLADDVVLVSPPTSQSIRGCSDAAARMSASRERAGFRSGPMRFLPVQSRADVLAERSLAMRWLDEHVRTFGPLLGDWTEVDPRELVPQLRIPHISYWGFGESLPVQTETGTDPLSASWSYQNVAGLLARGLSAADQLIAQRPAFLRAARARPDRRATSTAGWVQELRWRVEMSGGAAAYFGWRARHARPSDGMPTSGGAALWPDAPPVDLALFDWLRTTDLDAEGISDVQASWEREGRPSAPPPEAPAATAPQLPDHGLCLVLDIVGYSLTTRSTQQAMMRFLLERMMSLTVIANATRGRDFHVQSAGDGFLLVLGSRLSARAAPLLAENALALIDAGADFEQQFGERLVVRAALHRVSWSPGLAGLRDLNLMEGSGFGRAQLLCELAESGQVLASAEYIEDYLASLDHGQEERVTFFPDAGVDPWVVPLHNGREVRFRLARRPGERPAGQSDLPRLIAVQREARDRLRLELYSQVLFVGDVLGAPRAAGSGAVWRARLWCPGRNATAGKLVASTFGIDDRYEALPASRVQWDLDPSARNPLARAYHTGVPRSVVRLPEPGTRAYFTAWARRGVPRQTVDRFTRSSRCVLAIPFGFDIEHHPELQGVLCIDGAGPISASDAEVRDVMDEVQRLSSPYVAALWALING